MSLQYSESTSLLLEVSKKSQESLYTKSTDPYSSSSLSESSERMNVEEDNGNSGCGDSDALGLKEGGCFTTSLDWEKYYNRHMQLLVSLALFSYFGEYCRYALELIFGVACQNELEGATSWMDMLCVTDSNGPFFIDLPVNIIGCFLMGLFVSGDGESIAINIPVAALSRSCFFQKWMVFQVGLRTGFCGSLTTFASMNSQFVTMIYLHQNYTGALWGILIGLFASLQSFQFGVSIAFALSRKYNKQLADEADTIHNSLSYSKSGTSSTTLPKVKSINRDIPDFERRYIGSIYMNNHNRNSLDNNSNSANNIIEAARLVQDYFVESDSDNGDDENNSSDEEQQQGWTEEENYGRRSGLDTNSLVSNIDLEKYGYNNDHYHYNEHIHHLDGWKQSTKSLRHRESQVAKMQEIERNLLVDKIEPCQELLEIARDAGWDIGALQNWSSALDNNGLQEGDQKESSSLMEVSFTLCLFLLCTGWLLWNAIKTRRAQYFSCLISPIGTYCRWYFSRLNGTIEQRNWSWLPIGTLFANIIASVVSAISVAIAINSSVSGSSTAITIIATAMKTGYAGCFSTVSTFVVETTSLMRALPRHFWGYYYSFGSLFIALLFGLISFHATTCVILLY